MKAKDYIIIGSALALFYLYQKNKTKKLTTSANEDATTGEAQNESNQTGGVGGAVASQEASTPISNQPEQIFGVSLPSGGTTSTSPAVVTGGTATGSVTSTNTTLPSATTTEVAIQQGGVKTELQPAIVKDPSLTTEQSLIIGGVKPIVKNSYSSLDI